MGIQQVIDEIITPHGNRRGLSIGWLTTAWLSYILLESDHRMCEVEEWAEEHQITLQELLPNPVNQKDFTDDRLSDVLRYLSDELTWEQIENALGQRLIRVYNLGKESYTVHLDSTTVSVYHETEDTEIFRFGYSKDHRPDLPQFKLMLATLDPIGLPLTTIIVPGNETDDELYLPAINEAKKVVGCGERLYVGDKKMSTKENRATIESQGDYYLTPLAMSGEVPRLKQALLQQFVTNKHEFEIIKKTEIDNEGITSKILAIGFEKKRTESVIISKKEKVWQERVLAVFSPIFAKSLRQTFSKRLKQAEEKLLSLTPPPGHGKKQWDDILALKVAAQNIIETYQVEEFLSFDIEREVQQRRYVRAYKGQSDRYEEKVRYVIHVIHNKRAIKNERRSLGWRLYVTNAPIEKLSLTKAVLVYRASPSIERDFARLKGKSLGIRPLYVQREDHVIGMVRLLSLALRVLTTIEYVVRKRLMRTGKTISGLYAGNPKRKTRRPTAERLLKVFNGITLTVLEYPDTTKSHVTPLTQLQSRILRLMGFPEEIYIR